MTVLPAVSRVMLSAWKNRNAAGDQRAERARKTRDRGLAQQIAEKRHAQFEAIDQDDGRRACVRAKFVSRYDER